MNANRDSLKDNQQNWWRAPGVIYFLAAGHPASAIRIGVTTRSTLLERMKKAQVHNHESIELLGVIRFDDGEFPTRDAEDQQRLLLARFADLGRFKPLTRGAEWFTAAPELLKWISDTSISPEALGFPRFVCTLIDQNVVA